MLTSPPPDLLAASHHARDTGAAAITSPFGYGSPPQVSSIVLVMPVYAQPPTMPRPATVGERRSRIRGYASGVVPVDHVSQELAREASTLGLAPWQVDRARRDLAGWTDEGLQRAIQSLAATDAAVKGAEGKRLLYRQPHGAELQLLGDPPAAGA